jgi:hypothetical protein
MKLVAESLIEFLGEELNEAKGKRPHNPKAAVRNRGDVVFPAGSKSVKDDKDHFPINSEAQARNALARASQYSSSPGWYAGSLDSLVKRVSSAVHRKYPGIKVTKAGKTPGKQNESLNERQFSQKERVEMAKNGEAMKDGSFPIANVQDLKNAIKTYGRSKNKEAAKKHILKRAKELKAMDAIPSSWK